MLNLEIGIGTGSLSRWYYNVLTQQCAQFSYQGLKGNQNDFLSRQDCEKTCRGTWKLSGLSAAYVCQPGCALHYLVFANPCAQGEPILGSDSMPTKCGSAGSSNCPRNYWCHFGDSMETTVCCPGGKWIRMSRDIGIIITFDYCSYTKFLRPTNERWLWQWPIKSILL